MNRTASSRLAALAGGLLLAAAAGAQAPPAPAPQVAFTGLEKIPAEPRAVFEAYHRAVFARRAADALACLHDDFLGDDGARAERKKRLAMNWRNYIFEAVSIEVERAASATSYTRPRSLRAPEKTWTGELCVVASRIAVQLVQPRAKARQAQKLPLTQTVLRKDGGRWLIVADHADSRGQKALLLATDLTTALKTSLAAAKLWDGAKDSPALEVIRAKVPGLPPAAALTWEPFGIAMTGPDRDQPSIRGHLLGALPGSAPGAAPLCYLVVLTTVMDNDRLRLAAIEAKAVPYEPPEKEEPEKEEPEDVGDVG